VHVLVALPEKHCPLLQVQDRLLEKQLSQVFWLEQSASQNEREDLGLILLSGKLELEYQPILIVELAKIK